MFILFWDNATKQVKAMNGSGRSGAKCTLDTVRQDLERKGQPSDQIPHESIHAATVPGAPAGWVDTVNKFGSGKLSMSDVLGPAIKMGERGFPVSEVAAASVSHALTRSGSAEYTT